jgi:hypothetical protein
MSIDGPPRHALGEGAAQAAPTAPHATPRPKERDGRVRRTGPERFWWHRPVSFAFVVGLGLSLLVHAAAFPLEWPAHLQVNDLEGEAAIAVDLLEGSGVAAPEPAPAPAEHPAPEAPAGENAHEKNPTTPPVSALADAGSRSHALEQRDAASDAKADGGSTVDRPSSASGAPDAGLDSGLDAGAGDTEAIAGAAGALQADVVLVAVLVNAEVIRKNPVGVSLGALLRGIPQWEDFMSGTDIDPVRDTDWLMISGPSLVNTARDIVLIRYGASDAAVDRAIARVSRKYSGGGPFDAGVPGVKATLAHADRAERVLLRPRPHVLGVVPPAVAAKVARQLVTVGLPAHVLPGVAVYFRFESPHRAVPEIPESISELRLRVVPRADSGADAFLEGDAKDPESAAEAASEIEKAIRRRNSGLTSLLTHGIFDGVEVRAEGAKVLVHLSVTLEEIKTLASLAGAFLGVAMPDVPDVQHGSARDPATGATGATGVERVRPHPQ